MAITKDAYWFRHDSTAGRGLRMRKMAHIYGHWGKGIYWDVIEILRDQSDYMFNSDDSSLQMLCDLIGCKDEIKFINWFRDCVNITLFEISEGKFFSPVLSENMKKWEAKKTNPKRKNETRTKSKRNANETRTKVERKGRNKRIEEKRTEENINTPALEEFLNYCKEQLNGTYLNLEFSLKAKYNSWVAANWHDGNGKQIKNWKTKIMNTVPYLKPQTQTTSAYTGRDLN